MSDTTNADEAADVTLEDMTDGLETTETTDAPASAEEAEEVTEAETDADESTDGEETDSDEEQSDTTDDTNSEEAKKAAAQAAFQERRAAREQQEAQLAAAQARELAQFAEDVGNDPEQIAIKQQQQAAYQTTVASNVDRLTAQIDLAKNIPVFQNASPAIEKAMNDAINEFLVSNVTVDALGNPLQVRGNLYDFLQTKAGLIEELTRVGARKEKSNLAKQRALVTPKPSGSPKPQKTDKFLADFDAGFDN